MNNYMSPLFIQQIITSSIAYQNFSVVTDLFTKYNDSIKWDCLINFLIKNKSIPSFLEAIKRGGVRSEIPFYILEFIYKYSEIFEVQKTYYAKELVKIHDKFEQEKIDYRLVKGLILECTCYRNQSLKQISDLDIIVNKQDEDKVQKIYSELGYESGKFDFLNQKILYHSREKMLMYRLTGDHLPDQIKLISESPKIGLTIDTTVNVNWNKTKRTLLNPFSSIKYVNIHNRNIKTMDDISHIMYLISHLYKHGNSKRLLERNSGLRFSMFADLFVFIKYCEKLYGRQLITEVQYLCKQLNLSADFEWVMKNMNSIFTDNFESNNVTEIFLEYLQKDNKFLEDRLTSIYEKDAFN